MKGDSDAPAAKNCNLEFCAGTEERAARGLRVGFCVSSIMVNNDPRDAIWKEAYELRYRCRYAEEVEKALLARWT
jgi:hypothetical protein